MALETRRPAGAAYFYLCRRDPRTGRVVKQYYGRGAKADAAAAELEERRRRRAEDRRAVERAAAGLRAADEATAELDAAAALLMEAALLAAGFHRTNYGPWRRRRDRGANGAVPGGRAG
jgi:hypothetical protein